MNRYRVETVGSLTVRADSRADVDVAVREIVTACNIRFCWREVVIGEVVGVEQCEDDPTLWHVQVRLTCSAEGGDNLEADEDAYAFLARNLPKASESHCCWRSAHVDGVDTVRVQLDEEDIAC